MHLEVKKKTNLDIYTHASRQNSPPGTNHHSQAEGNYPFLSWQHFLENVPPPPPPPSRKGGGGNYNVISKTVILPSCLDNADIKFSNVFRASITLII